MEPGRICSREAPSEHIAQFFETRETLASCVADFLKAGADGGDNLLIVIKRQHREPVIDALAARGVATVQLASQGRLAVTDARTMLDLVMQDGMPDATRFDETIGSLVRKLSDTSPRGVRVYGELVEALAQEGNFRGAEALEDLWNELAAVERFTLLCGYQAAHFGPGVEEAGALQRICAKHTRIAQHEGDLLANWLLSVARLPES